VRWAGPGLWGLGGPAGLGRRPSSDAGNDGTDQRRYEQIG
jgi:hypothetical protein